METYDKIVNQLDKALILLERAAGELQYATTEIMGDYNSPLAMEIQEFLESIENLEGE